MIISKNQSIGEIIGSKKKRKRELLRYVVVYVGKNIFIESLRRKNCFWASSSIVELTDYDFQGENFFSLRSRGN